MSTTHLLIHQCSRYTLNVEPTRNYLVPPLLFSKYCISSSLRLLLLCPIIKTFPCRDPGFAKYARLCCCMMRTSYDEVVGLSGRNFGRTGSGVEQLEFASFPWCFSTKTPWKNHIPVNKQGIIHAPYNSPEVKVTQMVDLPFWLFLT